jgi:hypothetical protein
MGEFHILQIQSVIIHDYGTFQQSDPLAGNGVSLLVTPWLENSLLFEPPRVNLSNLVPHLETLPLPTSNLYPSAFNNCSVQFVKRSVLDQFVQKELQFSKAPDRPERSMGL